MVVNVGDKAPAFTLYNTQKEKVNLSDFKGKKVVLLFFPLAFSSTCTEELCTMRDNLNTYEGLDAQIMAVSVDSLYTLGKFKSEQQLNFPLLSDFNREVSRAYGALHEFFAYGMREVSKRAAFIIDDQGDVRYTEVLENPGNLPNFTALETTIKEIS